MAIKVGFIVGDDGWKFLTPLYERLKSRFESSVFGERRTSVPVIGGRINQALLRNDLANFMSAVDVAYFEWGTRLLCEATQLPKRCPIVVKLHGYDIFRWGSVIDWRKVDRAIVNLEAIERQVCTLYPEMAGKVTVIPVGLDLSTFKADSKRLGNTIGFLGGLIPRKRPYELILAVAELARRGVRFQLRVGGGDAKEFERYSMMLRALPPKLGIADSVRFDGHVQDTPSWFQGIDVFISNSYYETQHVALQEAMACGCYCLSHFWEGSGEILPPEHIFDTNERLLDRLDAYSGLTPSAKSEHCKKLRAIVEDKFEIGQTVNQLSGLLNQVAVG